MGDAGACQTSNKKDYDDAEDDAPAAALDEEDIALLKTYGLGPYTTSIKNIEKEISEAKVRQHQRSKGTRQGMWSTPRQQRYYPEYFVFYHQ